MIGALDDLFEIISYYSRGFLLNGIAIPTILPCDSVADYPRISTNYKGSSINVEKQLDGFEVLDYSFGGASVKVIN